MKKISWIVPVLGAVAVVFVALAKKQGGSSSDLAKGLVSPTGITASTCVGTKKCLVAVVAPWCGYCRRSTPMIKAMLERYKDNSKFSVNAVISADEAPAMETYAQELGAGAFSDPGGAFAGTLGVKGFPTWVLLDAKGGVIKAASGAFPSPEQLFAHMQIEVP